jgi:hypothetical protein
VPESPGVCVAYLHPGDVSGWFCMSLANMQAYDHRHGQHILGPKGDLIALQSSPRIAEARNKIIDMFAVLEQQPEWLLMIDSDMTFEPDLLEKLLEHAHPERVPILGGLCFAGGRVHAPYPTIYRQVDEGGYVSVDRVHEYPRDALVKVGATGGACLLMHRGALGAMKNYYGRDNAPYPWFAEGVIGPKGEPWGEDIVFCLRATAIGIPVHVHTGVKLGHVKTAVIDEVYFDNYYATVARDEADAAKAVVAGNGATKNRADRRRSAREKAGT